MERPPATFQVNGTAIRIRRMSLGMDIEQCAHKAGLSSSYLRQLELGFKRNMRPPTYTALRTALHLDPDDRRLLLQPPGPARKEVT